MMKIPESIRINGVEYTIRNTENLNDGRQMLDGRITYGDSLIQIKADQGHQHKCIILWHEIVHGILYHAGVELDDDTEEKIAEALGFGLYQVLQDNGKRLFDIAGKKKNAGEDDDGHEKFDGGMGRTKTRSEAVHSGCA